MRGGKGIKDKTRGKRRRKNNRGMDGRRGKKKRKSCQRSRGMGVKQMEERKRETVGERSKQEVEE